VPQGFAADHPLAEDLKRKDFTAIATFSEAQATRSDFLARFVAFCKTASPFNAFLARALGQDW
jgi:hypothetical protein